MSDWKLKYKKGCLVQAALNGEVNTIGHGCNCFTTFGAGIAKLIKTTFPAAYSVDRKTIKGDKKKLGTITYAHTRNILVINAYTQYTFWDPKRMLSYPAITKCMREIKALASGNDIGLPKIGAGLARGNWNKIEQIIIDELHDENVTIYCI